MQLDKDRLSEWRETTPYAAQMTKREKFAGQIMASLLSQPLNMECLVSVDKTTNDQFISGLARLAIRCADHLLSELQ